MGQLHLRQSLKKQVKIFVKNFFGFGSWKGKYWFIGLEPGGEKKEALARIKSFHCLKNYGGLVDCQDYHREIDKLAQTKLVADHFGPNAKLQRTWAGLIKIMLTAEKVNIKNETVRCFQKNNLGRTDLNTMTGNYGIQKDTSHCLIEFSPLSCHSQKDWNNKYKRLLGKNINKDEFYLDCINTRLSFIAKKFYKKKPRVVIFYGISEPKFLRAYNVLLEKFSKGKGRGRNYMIVRKVIEKKVIEITKLGSTICILIDHPAYVSNTFLLKVGKEIR